MNRRIEAWALPILVLGVVSPPALAEGKFCVVTNNQQNCYYYDANQCRAEAVRMGGMCVLNQGAGSSRSVLDIFRHIEEQGEKGRQAGIARRAAQATSQATEQPAVSWAVIAQAEEARQGKRRVVYSCNGVQGFLPVIGCVVVGYVDP